MLKLTKNRLAVFGMVVVASIGATLWLGSVTKSATSPQLVPIAGVSADTLAQAGITLQQPLGAVPAGAKDTAASAAQQFAGGAAIRDEQFAHCVAPGASIDEDCWAVSLDPSGFHANGPATIRQATYLVVLVDPTSGNALIGADGTP
ncbi:MAG TPA: hypothetical protein VGL78_10240 [Solirubrobacteraceae bacterium]|jgi:hypothetical protein